MKAIVCDKCGKVNLLDESKPYMFPPGIFRLVSDKDDREIDLCEECAEELMAAVREQRGG